MTPEEILLEEKISYFKKGNDLIIKCLNPEHEDNNPSMHVNSQTGVFHCFSCNAKGNLYTRFNKVVNTLNIKAQSILNMISKIKIDTYSIPEDADPFLEDYRNISAETFKHFEVFKTINGLDGKFKGRLILPITNYKGNIVSFMGRLQHSDIKPKYLAYPHGKSLPLFPSAVNIKGSTLVLVEGMFDLFNLYDKGLHNVITSFGLLSASKPKELKEKILPYKMAGVNKLIILYDGDTPGNEAARQLQEALIDYIKVEIITLKDGFDPGSLSQRAVTALIDKIKNT